VIVAARWQADALVFLPNLETVLLHRNSAVHQVMAECSVDESVASMLLNRHQGNVLAASRAWSQQHMGKRILASIAATTLP